MNEFLVDILREMHTIFHRKTLCQWVNIFSMNDEYSSEIAFIFFCIDRIVDTPSFISVWINYFLLSGVQIFFNAAFFADFLGTQIFNETALENICVCRWIYGLIWKLYCFLQPTKREEWSKKKKQFTLLWFCDEMQCFSTFRIYFCVFRSFFDGINCVWLAHRYRATAHFSYME